jgi:hypothetical protein
MREIKIQCDCGQKFKFEVEPVNGQMPYAVQCPVCNRDGTEKANAILRESLGANEPPPTHAAAIASVTAAPRLRIGSTAHSTPSTVAPMTAEAAGAPPPPAPSTKSSVTARYASIASSATLKEQKKGSFGMGLLGGLIGTLIGTTIYFLIFKYSGYQIKLLAVGVGALAGWGAELLGRGEGSKELGGITAALVLAGIVGAQYFVAMGWWHEIMGKGFADSAYTENINKAKEIVKAVPTGSDEEIRIYLAKEDVDEGEKPDPSAVSKEDIKEFKDGLPEFQDLASGKMTEAQYDAKHNIDPEKEKKIRTEVEGTFKGIFLILLLNKVNLVSLVAAAGLAFKMCTNA